MALATFDFIIIGGGTAGLVVANRLTENPKVQVLVLEAGENQVDNLLVSTPSLYTQLQGGEVDWNFLSVPQTGLNGRRIPLNQGKALGGSSAINAQIFVPPSRSIIDSWEELGNPGWSWDVLEPYFQKIYTNPSPDILQKELLGINFSAKKSGNVKTSYPDPYRDLGSYSWIQTFRKLGRQMLGDPFEDGASGGFVPLASVDAEGKRSHSASAYYEPVKERKNLHVFTGSVVQEILFEGKEVELKAVGVRYVSVNGTTTVKASKEVILSAGALQSPKILELSGIGDKKLLNKLGIVVKIDNSAVGENLQDHFIGGIGFEASENVTTKDGLIRQEPRAVAAALLEYFTFKTGPLASVGISAYAYLPVMSLLSPAGEKELNTLLDTNAKFSNSTTLSKQYYQIARSLLKDKTQASAFFLAANGQGSAPTVIPQGVQPGKYISLATILATPLSRGTVHISSTDISLPPTINPNYLTHPLDLEIFSRHLLYLHTLSKLEPFATTMLKPNGRLWDPASNFTSLERAREYARSGGISMWHPTSTCSMLPRENGGVVDTSLRVYGTKGLRIVDASVFPIVPRANPQSAVYAVAERASDLIKSTWGL